MPDELATTSEAARALGVSARSLARWAQDGTVTPTVRTPGGHFRWDIDDLRRQLSTAQAASVDQPQTAAEGRLPPKDG